MIEPSLDPVHTPRRGFLARLAALGAMAAGGVAAGAVPVPARAQRASSSRTVRPGDPWMDALTAPHRTVIDALNLADGRVLGQARNYLEAWREGYGVSQRDVNLIVAVHGSAVPLVMRDATWAALRLGEFANVRDGSSATPATRNPYIAAHVHAAGPVTAAQSIESLQAAGVRFVLCRNSVAGTARRLAAAGRGEASALEAALLEGALPGVITVPAMVVTLTQLQERDVAYVMGP